MLNIIPYHDKSSFCLEDQVISIARWFKRDYELMYINCWGFNFYNSEEYNKLALGERIGPDNSNVLESLDKFHGITYNTYNNINFEDSLKIIKNEIQKLRPVVVFADSYYCNWEHNYKKSHFNHAFIITGIDVSGGFFHCVDAYRMKSSLKISYSDFQSGFNGYLIIFDLNRNFSINMNYRDMISLILKRLKYNSKDSIFDLIRLFADEVLVSLDLKKELEMNEKVWFSPLCYNIDRITRSRMQFEIALKYMSGFFSVRNLGKVSRYFKLIYNQWNILRNMIVKEYYKEFKKNNEVLERISGRIKKIADMEESVVPYLKMILNYGDKKEIDIEKKMSITGVSEKYNSIFFLNISNFMNNKAFCLSLSDVENAGINEQGDVLLADGLPGNKIWETNDMKFSFPDITSNNCDNILCAGQSISVPLNNYNTIMFLGFSESGNFSEKVYLKFEDDTHDIINLSLSDIYEDKPFYNETLVNKVGWYNKKIDVKYSWTAGIYAVSYPIQNSKRGLIDIKLPVCMNMHIFAVSLGYNK